MATFRQKKALEKLVEYGRAGKRVSKGKLLRDVGYAGTTAIAPQKVFESKGFLDLCDSAGLTDEFLTRALYDDIKAKPKKRKPELELAFKIRGRLKEEPLTPGVINNFNFFNEHQLRRIAARAIDGDTASEEKLDGLSDSNEPEVRSELAPRVDSEGIRET